VQAFGPNYYTFFDTRTGDIWEYVHLDKPAHFRIAKLGAPLVEIK
jgi:hypothetical protein